MITASSSSTSSTLLYLYRVAKNSDGTIEVIYPEKNEGLGGDYFTSFEALQQQVCREALDLGLQRYLILSLEEWNQLLVECHHVEDLGGILVKKSKRIHTLSEQPTV